MYSLMILALVLNSLELAVERANFSSIVCQSTTLHWVLIPTWKISGISELCLSARECGKKVLGYIQLILLVHTSKSYTCILTCLIALFLTCLAILAMVLNSLEL